MMNLSIEDSELFLARAVLGEKSGPLGQLVEQRKWLTKRIGTTFTDHDSREDARISKGLLVLVEDKISEICQPLADKMHPMLAKVDEWVCTMFKSHGIQYDDSQRPLCQWTNVTNASDESLRAIHRELHTKLGLTLRA